MKYNKNTDYVNVEPILTAVDCIIFGVTDNELKLLLFKREVEPLAGRWSLIGDFVKLNESVSNAAERVLQEVTGLTNIYMEQLHSFGGINRDPGGRVISVAHWSLIKADQFHRDFQVKNHVAKWVPFKEVPPLILDHGDMVNMAITQLREKAKFHPVGFELLPDEFTLPQLLGVYEAIFSREIDDRNFRKKMLKSNLLIRLPKKDMTTSRKGSYLYKFDHDTYKKLSDEGYDFKF